MQSPADDGQKQTKRCWEVMVGRLTAETICDNNDGKENLPGLVKMRQTPCTHLSQTQLFIHRPESVDKYQYSTGSVDKYKCSTGRESGEKW